MAKNDEENELIWGEMCEEVLYIVIVYNITVSMCRSAATEKAGSRYEECRRGFTRKYHA